jgi:demethoxyubiquinone hydroxylase (CLK1/Coq7/Cat5 family)
MFFMQRALDNNYLQGCHGDKRTDTFVRPSVMFNKARVHQIRVNGMLTSDRVKPELLCPRWLPHRYHIGSLAIML